MLFACHCTVLSDRMAGAKRSLDFHDLESDEDSSSVECVGGGSAKSFETIAPAGRPARTMISLSMMLLTPFD